MYPDDLDDILSSTTDSCTNTFDILSSSFVTPSPILTIPGEEPIIQTDKSTINLDELAETVEVLKQRLLVLTPMLEKHELYPALKSAYDNYKMIEKMISEGK